MYTLIYRDGLREHLKKVPKKTQLVDKSSDSSDSSDNSESSSDDSSTDSTNTDGTCFCRIT